MFVETVVSGFIHAERSKVETYSYNFPGGQALESMKKNYSPKYLFWSMEHWKRDNIAHERVFFTTFMYILYAKLSEGIELL